MTPAQPLIVVVDYGMGNRRSVEKALEHVGARALISSRVEDLDRADGLVLPGVGAFPRAVANLAELGLAEALHRRVGEGTPLLGVCLGMQVLFERSEELGGAEGLGLLPGTVSALRSGGLRVPHIGWNQVMFRRPSRLTAGLPADGCPMYHVHSLAVRPAEAADVIAETEYGETFATAVERGEVFGVQFHPEKSSADGLRMLGNFVAICAGAVDASTAPRVRDAA